MQENATDRCKQIKRSGEQCKARAIKGSMVCHMHGGQLPNVKRSAQLRLKRDEAQQEMIARLKATRGEGKRDVLAELDRLAAEVIVFKDICGERLLELREDEWRYEGNTGEQLHAFVALYERALDRCNNILGTHVKLNLTEKRMALQKAEAEAVAAAIRTILSRLGLSREQKIIAGTVVQEEMLAISAAVNE